MTDDERSVDERKAFERYLEIDEAARPEFLAELAESQPDIAERVRRLAAAHERADDAASGWPADSAKAKAPERIGPYKLLERLGEGGMGVVYLAEQREPVRRRVALKLLRPGLDSDEISTRFSNERRTLALMSHPGIARLIDAGTASDGRPYLVMEYVPGRPATDFADRHSFTLHDRIDLFVDVLEAIRHAHLRGVIHRDLKPSNVLVRMEGQRPVAKIIDFGVAKPMGLLGDTSLYTRSGVLVGTPQYMSPEQADGRVQEVDMRSDVYSLGMVLYELLVGALPFERHPDPVVDVPNIVARIRRGDLPPPSVLLSSLDDRSKLAALRDTSPREHQRALRRELDWIVARATASDVRRRYESVAEFADDLRKYRDGQPVEAGPNALTYRLTKFVRRHAVAVAAAAGLVLVATAYTITLQRTNLRIGNALRVAEIEATRATDLTGILTGLLAVPRSGQAPEDSALARGLISRGIEEAERLEAQPERQGHLLSLLGSVYSRIGDYERAIEMFEAALEVHRGLYGEEHLNVAESERSLGESYRRMGRLDEAKETLDRVLAVERDILPSDHARIATTLTELHLAHREAGELDAAEARLSEGLTMRARLTGGKPDPELAESINLLGALLRRRGRLEEARRSYELALEMRRALVPNGESTQIAESLNNLGVQAVMEGDFEGADTLYEEAGVLFAKLLGEDHPFVSLAISNRAGALRRLDRREEAVVLLRRQLEIDSLRFGPYSLQLGMIHLMMAINFRELGRYDESLSEYELAEANVVRSVGTEHSQYGITLHSWARLYLVNGDPVGGLQLADRAVVAMEAAQPRLHRDPIVAYRTRGELLFAAGRDRAAKQDLEEAWIRVREGGESSAELFPATAEALVAVYDRLNDEEGADSIRALM